MPASATVFVVHPDPQVRQSVHALADSMHVPCESFAATREFLERKPDNPHGCLLTFAPSLERGDFSLLDEPRQWPRSLPVIMTSPHPDPPTEMRALRSGVLEFLVDPNGEALEAAIRRGLQAAEAQRRKQGQRAQTQRECNETLRRLTRVTAPERAVLDLVLQGELNKSIARQLDVSVRTVEQRRRSVMRKMEAESLPNLVRQITRLQMFQELVD
jgi:two-component system response regulator TtrR